MPKLNKAATLAQAIPGFVSLAPFSAARDAGLTRNGAEVVWLRRDDLWHVGLVDPATAEVLETAPAPASAWVTYGRDACGRAIESRYYVGGTCILAPHPASLPCRATSVLPPSRNEKLS